MTMHGKIIQIAGAGTSIYALTSTGKILVLVRNFDTKKNEWMDATPDVIMTDKERELLNSLEEKDEN